MSRLVTHVAAIAAVLAAAACGGATGAGGPTATTATTSTTAASGESLRRPGQPIASVWRARCAQCHTPVEPKTRDRGQLVEALARHRSRTRLAEADWQEMVDYLAR